MTVRETRTQADRELDWATGRELERKDAEIERLRAREKLLESVIERQALGLMKIRTMQGNPVQIARDAMDESALEQNVSGEVDA